MVQSAHGYNGSQAVKSSGSHSIVLGLEQANQIQAKLLTNKPYLTRRKLISQNPSGFKSDNILPTISDKPGTVIKEKKMKNSTTAAGIIAGGTVEDHNESVQNVTSSPGQFLMLSKDQIVRVVKKPAQGTPKTAAYHESVSYGSSPVPPFKTNKA